MNVLIVEDNAISATVLEHTLDKHGYETLTANDGDQALAYLESHPEIDLVITDLVMPNTDGIELVRKIKERDEWNAIPILVCTSMRPENANHRLTGQGWNYVLKPIKADSLIQKVKLAFAQQRKVLQDPELTRAQIGIDAEAFAEVVDKFSETVNRTVTRLEQQSEVGSPEAVDLKDLLEGAKLVRAERLADLLTRIEHCSSGRKQETIRSICPSLLRELKAMQYQLKVYTS
jgi:twitching motility two-component system response regulator PilH